MAKMISIFLFILSSSVVLGQGVELLENERNTIKIFKKTAGSVVNITRYSNRKTLSIFDLDVSVPQREIGGGSGFVWDKQGHIITNYHVVADADSFLVSFKNDTKRYRAKLIGGEPRKDLAVLRLTEKPKNLVPLKLTKTSSLQVGQKALAIGNPFGLDQTITEGIISALDRRIPGYAGVKIYGMIQTDCSINPGNSGGPLLDSQGRVIGINTQIYSASGTSAGIGFAVPADIIHRMVPQIIKYGKIIRPGLGVGLLLDNYREYFKVKKGIVIKYVEPGSPADKIGLKGLSQNSRGEVFLGDVIIAIDDKRINTYDDIYNILDRYKVGDTIKVTYIRKGKEKKSMLKLKRVD